MRANAVTWLVLLALTFTGYAVSDRLGASAVVPILTFAAIKSSLVGFRFMGFNGAHGLVRAAFVALIGGLVLAIFLAQRVV